MVRLKASVGSASIDAPTGFQFQYGSIKREEIKTERILVNGFQFQYGSIKSRCENTNF